MHINIGQVFRIILPYETLWIETNFVLIVYLYFTIQYQVFYLYWTKCPITFDMLQHLSYWCDVQSAVRLDIFFNIELVFLDSFMHLLIYAL